MTTAIPVTNVDTSAEPNQRSFAPSALTADRDAECQADKLPMILAVDDRQDSCQDNLAAIDMALADVEVQVVHARSGNEALSLLMRHEFAVILLDLEVDDLNSFETAALIRGNRETRGVPIVFITASKGGEGLMFLGYESGAVDYMHKPLDPAILQAKVRFFLDVYLQKAELEREVVRRRQVNKQLKSSQLKLKTQADALKRSNEELEQMAFVVSHDLQEPLRKVTAFCQLLEQSCGDKLNAEERTYIDFAVDGARRMKELISDLLALSRVGNHGTTRSPTCAEKAINEALINLEYVIEEAGADVTHDKLPTVMGNNRQLAQLFQNLIGNAIKYRLDDRPPKIQITAKQTNGEWLFSVQDNGIGISRDYQAKIFEIFKRLHTRSEYSGTGIGLAICKKIVGSLGGRLWVESEEHVGSTFFFTLHKAKKTDNEQQSPNATLEELAQTDA